MTIKAELSLMFLAVWTYFEALFTPAFLDGTERAFRWCTMAIAFAIAVVRLIRTFKGKDDDDFAGTR